MFAAAFDLYQRNNRKWTLISAGPLMGALFLALMAVTFLLGLDFGFLVPLFLIGGGLVLLGRGMLPRSRPVGDNK